MRRWSLVWRCKPLGVVARRSRSRHWRRPTRVASCGLAQPQIACTKPDHCHTGGSPPSRCSTLRPLQRSPYRSGGFCQFVVQCGGNTCTLFGAQTIADRCLQLGGHGLYPYQSEIAGTPTQGVGKETRARQVLLFQQLASPRYAATCSRTGTTRLISWSVGSVFRS